MLAPHDGENAQFRVARLAAENALNLVELLQREIVLGDKFRGDGGIAHGHCLPQAALAIRPSSPPAKPSRINRPSAEPKIASLARSGCGIRPATLRASLQMPAMLRNEPFGLAASVNWPSASLYCQRIRSSFSNCSRVASSAK